MQEDVVSGDLRVESSVGHLPGKAVWPLLGCLYRSTDTGSGPFGVGRSAGGLLGVKVVAVSGNTSNANVYDETGARAYFTYSGGAYTNRSGGLNKLYPEGTGWLLERSVGLYFEFDSAGKVIAGHDPSNNTLYFGYDGSGHYQKVLSHETGLAVYFETDGSGGSTILQIAPLSTVNLHCAPGPLITGPV